MDVVDSIRLVFVEASGTPMWNFDLLRTLSGKSSDEEKERTVSRLSFLNESGYRIVLWHDDGSDARLARGVRRDSSVDGCGCEKPETDVDGTYRQIDGERDRTGSCPLMSKEFGLRSITVHRWRQIGQAVRARETFEVDGRSSTNRWSHEVEPVRVSKLAT